MVAQQQLADINIRNKVSVGVEGGGWGGGTYADNRGMGGGGGGQGSHAMCQGEGQIQSVCPGGPPPPPPPFRRFCFFAMQIALK